MAPEDISHINGILQAYEGMGIVRTIDNKTALIEVWVMPLYEDDFLTVLEDLARETDFTIVEKERPFDGADSL